MLVLSRKQNQSIVINEDIRVTVVSIRGSQVRIGIEAPESVAILREELCEPAPVTEKTPQLVGAGARRGHLAMGSTHDCGDRRSPRSVRR